ncbi:threonine/serine exporter family protein [Streptacidiphilus sp. ASG 303]|uniref:threonine/serine exporter family protein n=1 Tax=Streptacidiphilus sp. ASG 303 TaxID=2896847 RepID=UPI001E6114CC|nr:threonine/serine exporter family protein [Streptacidiphilus sp. ASG 303]MCD0482462.1 threonine/serine exporter family protein [Streptacidiphilus sp. ASG 303]
MPEAADRTGRGTTRQADGEREAESRRTDGRGPAGHGRGGRTGQDRRADAARTRAAGPRGAGPSPSDASPSDAPASDARPSGPRSSGPEPSGPEPSGPAPAGLPHPSEAPPTQGLLGPVGDPAPAGDDWRTLGYTPPSGIPVPSLQIGAPGAAPWPDRMRTLLRTPMSERPLFERTQQEDKPEGSGPNVPRVLDLALRIGELLLASGESAEDVEAAMLGVTHAYGLDRCEPQVTFIMISISYQPSLVDAPVTADRTVRRRASDYTRLAAVYRLVADITAERAGVNDAYRRLAEIRRNRHPYPGWLLSLCAGGLAGAASLLVGGQLDARAWLVFATAFTAAVLGDRLAWLVAGRGLPEFYQFVLAAMPAAGTGVILALAGPGTGLRGSVVITGGLFALIPGRALVSAVQDGLTGFYITAAARLLEVLYLVAGIITGVLLVLYVGVRFGAELRPEQSLLSHSYPLLQLAAAMLLTLAFAVMLQSHRRTLLLVTLNGGVGWAVYGALTVDADVSPVVATGVAAGIVGLFGQLASRYRYASALPYVTAALGPLLPGSAMYLGMLSVAQGDATEGLVAVSRAAALALALAVGVNLGGEVARLFMRMPAGVGAGVGAAQRPAAKRTRGF